ncbi:MAG: carboxy terminal-processing peptidase [Pseudomonadales bacterium]
MIRLICFLALSLSLGFLAGTQAFNADTAKSGIAYTKAQAKTAKEIIDRLTHYHYQDLPFDDDLSSTLLDHYLANLDPGKSFFTRQDVNRFEKYRLSLDDKLKKGDLAPGFEIFTRYQELLVQRLEQNLKQLPQLIQNFDYKKDEALTYDRSELPWPKNAKEADEVWRKRIKASALSLKLAGKSSEEIEKVLRKRFAGQVKRLQQMNSEDVFQVFVNSLAQLYDPHTSYLSPRNSENFNINMSLSLEGIGAVLQREDEYTKVVRLVPAGPADKQGAIQPADRIIGVGQGETKGVVDVVGWRLDEVVDLIRGPKGTKVRLQVIPAGAASEDETKLVTIVRNKVKLEEQSAQKKVIELVQDDQLYKIGVIDIPAFYIDFDALRRRDPDYKSTTRDVKRLIDELVTEGVAGIIVDLRDNGGGSLREANALSRLFIDSGPTVQIRHANSRVDREPKSRSNGAYYDGPLAVVINRLSASASEIFAAAIQDYERGVIVGSQSFGKGTVQSLSPLTEGHLKLTESKFYRVSGDSTQHRGVIPDVLFPELYDTQEVGESALEKALSWDTIHAVPHRNYYPIDAILSALQEQHGARAKTDPDFVYLHDQIALLEKSRQRKTLSLNESVRRDQKTADKAAQLSIENKRRIAKGEEPLAELGDEDTEPEEKVAQPSAQTNKEKEEDVPDAFLQEAGNILLDSIMLFKQHVVSQ